MRVLLFSALTVVPAQIVENLYNVKRGRKNIMKIQTERLILRPMRMDDAQATYTWQSDAEVQESPNTDISQTIEYLEWVTGEWQSDHQKYYSFGIMLSDKLIWEISFSNGCGKCGRCVEGEAALGYSIHRDYWNCGYETEAIDAIIEYCFSTLGAEKIKMSRDVESLAELREIERLGMQLILENEDCETFDGKPFKRNTYILNKSCSK